jgi:serine/threonine protein kinase
MSLIPGTQIGTYAILAPLGSGGMGEVFQARDLKLGRQVAIKVLRSELAQDPERLARFRREARLLAALNHPNIAALYGLEEPDGLPFLVMELVPGWTLAQRLTDGPLDLEEAVCLALQITQALEAAHEQGIIHRDLKPANIKVTPEGKAKVLDFGLAKTLIVDADPAAPTASYDGTREGAILGTPAYMSPEQVRAQPLDKRTDVWSFGCLLYEMLAGQRAFAGATAADIMAAVLEREPDWAALPPSTPTSVRDVLRRCLRKDQGRRPRDIGDLRLGLEEAEEALQAVPVRPVGPAFPVSPAATATVTTAPADGKDPARTDDAHLEQLRRTVFASRLRRLLREIKWRPITAGSNFAALTILIWFVFWALLGGLLAEVHNYSSPLIPVFMGCLIGFPLALLTTWGLDLLARRRKEGALRRMIARMDQEFPQELQRWGGRSVFLDRVTVEGILSILENGSRRPG